MEHLTVVHQGIMEKRGGGTWSKKYKKRCFQLQCGATEKRLVYFKGDPKKVKAQGFIDLNEAESITLNEEKKRIEIALPERTYMLRPKTLGECKTWIQWMECDPDKAQRKTIRFGQGTLMNLMEELEPSYDSEDTTDPELDAGNFSNTSCDTLRMGSDASASESVAGDKNFNETRDRMISTLHNADTLHKNLQEMDFTSLKNIYSPASPYVPATPPTPADVVDEDLPEVTAS